MTKKQIIYNLRKLSKKQNWQYEYYVDYETGVYCATITGNDTEFIKDYLKKLGMEYSVLGSSCANYDLGIMVTILKEE